MKRFIFILGVLFLMGCATDNFAGKIDSTWQFSDEVEYYGKRSFDDPIIAAQIIGNLKYAKYQVGFEGFAEAFSSEVTEAFSWVLILDIAPEAGFLEARAIFNRNNEDATIWIGSDSDDIRRFTYEKKSLNITKSIDTFAQAQSLSTREAKDCIGEGFLDARTLYLTVYNDGKIVRFSYFEPFSDSAECDFIKEYYKFIEAVEK